MHQQASAAVSGALVVLSVLGLNLSRDLWTQQTYEAQVTWVWRQDKLPHEARALLTGIL